jgi:hypothetical protein
MLLLLRHLRAMLPSFAPSLQGDCCRYSNAQRAAIITPRSTRAVGELTSIGFPERPIESAVKDHE